MALQVLAKVRSGWLLVAGGDCCGQHGLVRLNGEDGLIGLNGVIVGCAFVNLEYRATVSYAAKDLLDLLIVESSSRISLSVCKW